MNYKNYFKKKLIEDAIRPSTPPVDVPELDEIPGSPYGSPRPPLTYPRPNMPRPQPRPIRPGMRNAPPSPRSTKTTRI